MDTFFYVLYANSIGKFNGSLFFMLYRETAIVNLLFYRFQKKNYLIKL